MRSLVSALLALLLLAAPAASLAADVTQDFPVKGWSCEGCSARTASAVKAVKVVRTAKADFARKLVAVAFDDAQTSADAIRAAIEKAGFGCPLPQKKQ